eukprot:COSAG02_NODE_760_length_17479_cov_23.555178_16_plen_1224_part_00
MQSAARAYRVAAPARARRAAIASACPPLAPTARKAHTHYATDMFCSSKLKTTPRGGESPPSRDDKAPSTVATSGGVDQPICDQLMQIFVRGAPNQTHTLRLGLSDTMGGLNTAVQRFGYDLSADRLCHFGGASLPRDDSVSIAESGLHTNSSLQVLGRLWGGVEVTLFGQQHSLGDTGFLDLKGQHVGPAKLKEVATFLASPESTAVRRLVLSGNRITNRGKDLSGLKALCKVLLTLKHPISLDLANCGLGVAEVAEVAAAIHASAAVNSLILDSNPILEMSIGEVGMHVVVKSWGEVYDSAERYASALGVSDIWASGNICRNGDAATVIATPQGAECPCVAIRLATNGDIVLIGKDGLSAINRQAFAILCSNVAHSQITNLSLQSCSIDKEAVNEVAKALSAASMTTINCLANQFGDEGLAILLAAIEGTSVRSLCGLTEGQTVAEFSGQNLGPTDVKIMAAEYGFQGFIAAVKKITLSKNFLFGSKLKHGNWGDTVHDIDADRTGWSSLCDSFKGSSIEELILCDVGMGVNGVASLGDAIKFMAVTARLTLRGNKITASKTWEDYDSDDSDDEPEYDCDLSGLTSLCESFEQSQTLTEIDVSECSLGPNALPPLAKAMKLMAALNSLTVDSTGVMDEIYNEEIDDYEHGQKPYTLTTCTEIIELSSKNLGPADVALVATWLQRPEVSAALTSIALDGCTITGTTFGTSYEQHLGGECEEIEKLDVDLSGFNSFCSAMKSSQIVSLSLQKCYLGPGALALLAEAIQFMAVLTSINCLANKFGDDDLATLLTAIEGTSVRSLCGLTEGQTTADFSGQNLGPIDCKIIAAEYGFQGFSAAVASLHCGNNPGMVGKVDDYGRLTTDAHAEVFKELTDSLKISQVTEADFSSCGIGPVALGHLSEWVREATAVVNCLTLDMNGIFGELYSNGDVKEADKFASDCDAFLAALKGSNIVTLSLQKTGIGPVTLQKLATSLPAVLTSINCLANRFGEEDLATLLTAIEGTSVRSLCGLTEGQTIADFSGQNLRPIDMKIMAAEYGFQGFIAALNSLQCANNPGMVGELWGNGTLKTPDVHADVFEQLTDGLKSSQVTEVDFSSCGIGPVGLGHLSDWVREATAAIEKVNVSGCTVTPEVAAQLLTAANEASRARLRAHQVLAFSEALHARLGSECLLQAVALDTDVWRHVAENVRERHGHEHMCSQLAQAGQTWFEVTVEGLIAEGVPR